MTQSVEGGLTYTQTFDAENSLISVSVSGQTTQFIYDGDGNLVKKIKPDGQRVFKLRIQTSHNLSCTQPYMTI